MLAQPEQENSFRMVSVVLVTNEDESRFLLQEKHQHPNPEFEGLVCMFGGNQLPEETEPREILTRRIEEEFAGELASLILARARRIHESSIPDEWENYDLVYFVVYSANLSNEEFRSLESRLNDEGAINEGLGVVFSRDELLVLLQDEKHFLPGHHGLIRKFVR